MNGCFPLIKDSDGKTILSTDEILYDLEYYKGLLIEIGYEQASCNDEGLVDYGDACRILREELPERESINPVTAGLIVTLIGIYGAEKQFNNEFKQ